VPAGGVAAQDAALFVPVPQDDPLAPAARQVDFVHGRAMRVAVDHPRHAMRREGLLNGARVHVHDLLALALHGLAAARAQGLRLGDALLQGQGEELGLPGRIAQPAAQGLIVDVVRAEGVAMQEQGGRTVQVDDLRLGQESQAAALGEGLADEEVAIAVHEGHRHAGIAHRAQALCDGRERGAEARIVEHVVADPVLEQVAEDVERLRLRRLLGQESQEEGDDLRTAGVQVQIGDEERLAHATRRA
jgi:hypothetical protein